MHVASQRGFIDVVKVLLAFGANVHDKNKVSKCDNDIIHDCGDNIYIGWENGSGCN